jgi:hypothetical protein
MADVGIAGERTCKGQSDPHSVSLRCDVSSASPGVVQGAFGSLVGRWVLVASSAVPAARLAVPASRQAEPQGSAALFQDPLRLASISRWVRRSRR